MEFDADVDGAGGGQEGEGLSLEDQCGVSGVVNDHEIVPPGEIDHRGEEFRRGGGSRGIVGIIQHQCLGAAEFVGGDDAEIGQELIFFQKREIENLAAVILAVGPEDRVSGRGHEGHVAGVDEAGREDRQGGLGADGVNDLRVRIDAGYAADVLHPAGGGLLE